MVIFKQNSFVGGLNSQLDSEKLPENSYSLLVNGRTRRNVISPTPRHVRINTPVGTFQGLYVIGDFLVVFISGAAYYADITVSPILLHPINGWTLMDTTVPRIYAELVPASSNLFNKTGTPDSTVKVFNSAIAIFDQALFCFDGKGSRQAIFPDGHSVTLGTYATWTMDNPEYVPDGVLPAFCSNKLFLADPDRIKILHSVSGRAHDFVVNLTSTGDKGGDADTVSATVSLNEITCMRALSSGQVLIGTLYGTHVLTLDYTNTIFGEPFLKPDLLFPAGPLNEISIVDILQDTAFITQSGIHAFNVVAQAKRESNNYPLGAKIRGLITDPITEKAITQSDTCAGLYDDYAFFAVNTIHGYGCLVYDTTTQTFHALDLSFGHVKQFATTKLAGSERLFFITHDNELFEAFADEDKNITRAYFGEWAPELANTQSISNMIDVVFTSVRTSGHCKISIYRDREYVCSEVFEVTSPGFNANIPIPIPYPDSNQRVDVSYNYSPCVRAWKLGVMVEWDFDGKLTSLSVDGETESSDNNELTVQETDETTKLAFLSDSGYGSEFNPGGAFVGGFDTIAVIQGNKYIYFANGNGNLINGNEKISQGIFTAKTDHVAIGGTGARSYSLKLANNYIAVLDAIKEEIPAVILHGGDFGYPNGTVLEVNMAKYPIGSSWPFFGVPGNHDILTANGAAYFNLLGQPRHYSKQWGYIDIFFMDGNPTTPDGIVVTSIQAGLIKDWAANSTARYKLVLVHQAPYTNDSIHYPGETNLRYLNASLGIHGVISGHGHLMERFVVNSFPYFVCGAGGQPLRSLHANAVDNAFSDTVHYGYLLITADALTCNITFKSTTGAVLDSYAIYA